MSTPACGDRSRETGADHVHAADGHEDPLDRIHVGDHGIQREGFVRGETGVHRLEREDPAEPLVLEERGDLLVEPSEPAEPDQLETGAPGLHQVERRVEVGVDERRHLRSVEIGQPVTKAPERGRVLRAGERPDLLGHRLATVAHEQCRPVGVDGPVHGVDRLDRDEVGHVGAGRVERVRQQIRHRQHRGPVVEPEPLGDHHAGATTRLARPLEDRDLVAAIRQMGRGRQPSQARTDHDDAHQPAQIIRPGSLAQVIW